MQAIILAGGFGTRLKSVTGDTIKPMAQLAGRPFLSWLLDYIAQQGVREVMLCLHHQPEQITRYFGSRYAGMELRYLIEEQPLGTGGALANAMRELKPNRPAFALNGDSLVMVNYRRMMRNHIASGRPISIATTRMPDCRRYSQLNIQNDLITRYELYGDQQEGDISVGFYVLSPEVFEGMYSSPARNDGYSGFAESSFSFERDFLAPNTPELKPAAYEDVDYFIDIGVPEDHARAQREIPDILNLRKPIAA
ncbi:MAG: NTP transferase domain-containing protein [Rickettsiales bacterium]|jgi:D-glycero-alpha-D-manno-heptose 1-phosphate guanylyltransferase|nr:NTP transferase domain-containing protein [Rickettsiales bacterium]